MNYKNIANKILAFVFMLFFLSIYLRYIYKDLLVVKIFSDVVEAALVGGIADWFAITAIFRKPLGFPWHTALIPRHRERVIFAIRDMIANDLLSAQSIKKRVNEIHFVTLLIRWVDRENGKQFLQTVVEKHSRHMIMKIDAPALAESLSHFIKNKVRQVKTISQIKILIRWGLQHEKDQYVIALLIDALINRIQEPDTKQVIYQYIDNIKQEKSKSLLEKVVIWIGEQTNSLNVADAADTVYQELLTILQEMKNPEHILYQWIQKKIIKFANQPEPNVLSLDRIDRWKIAMLESEEFTEIIKNCTEILIEKASTSAHNDLLGWIYSQADQHWERFKNDDEMQQWLEVRIKQAMLQLIDGEHYLIGKVIGEVLGKFTDEDLNTFIEEKAGDDLQWIRINGCIVGAMVGMIISLFLHYFYEPSIVPVVQEWFYRR